MNIQDKLEILNLHLNNVNSHIEKLELAIKEQPDGDMPDKEPRSSVLLEFRSKKEILENMISDLQKTNIPE